MDATRTPSRNGSEKPKAPSEGEKGTSFAWGFEGIAPADILGERPKPTPADLDNMLNVDGWAEAIYGALTWPIRRLKWSVVEADGDTGEAEEVRRQLEPLLRRIVAGMCQAVGHSVAYAELVWETQDAEGNPVPPDSPAARWVALEDVAFRPISTCRPIRDQNGHVTGFKQVAYGQTGMVNEEFLVAERKAFIYAHDSTTNPGVGRSAFATAYQYFKDKRKVLFYRFKNLEKFGGPTTVGKTKASGEKRQAFEKAGRDARSGAFVAIDSDDELSYLVTPNAGLAFRQAITDLNFEMAVSALVQWLAYAQEGNSGSYNASATQMDLLKDVTGGRVEEMQDAAWDLAKAICDLNFGLNAAVPTIEAEILDEDARQTVKDAGEKVLNWQAMPDWFKEALTEAYARLMDIEKPDNAETLPSEAEEETGAGEQTTEEPTEPNEKGEAAKL